MPGNSRYTKAEEGHILLLWQKGLSTKFIARAMRRSRTGIYKFLAGKRQELGEEVVPKRRGGRGGSIPSQQYDLMLDEMIRLFNSGLSMRGISDALGLSSSTMVHTRLKRVESEQPERLLRPMRRIWKGMMSSRIALYWRWHLMREAGWTVQEIVRQTREEWEEGVPTALMEGDVYRGTRRIRMVLEREGYEVLRPYVGHITVEEEMGDGRKETREAQNCL